VHVVELQISPTENELIKIGVHGAVGQQLQLHDLPPLTPFKINVKHTMKISLSCIFVYR